ncbi:MAG TPA: TIM barrel protein [Phycisphaerales bacterium]|nr:TIM barrel protein [Phycisphaerales bacterium]HRQ74422.1 TIM barrel protein [Phycisphaerales bacterium]
MNRREFTRTTLAAGMAATTGALTSTAQAKYRNMRSAGPFKLDYAPHFGMFSAHAGDDPVDQLRFMADEGFRSLEDNGMASRSIDEQNRIGAELERLNMRMGVFVVNMETAWRPTLSTGRSDMREQFLDECRRAVEVAKRVNATWMTVVPGTLDGRLEVDYQMANVIEALRQGAGIFEPHGLVMVLEPLNHRRDHPGMFLTRIPQAYAICRAVNSPACKILNDLYHQQITEGNLIPNIDLAWDETPYFQVGDNPGRREPGTGEINYRNVFRHIHTKGFTGIVGMEHGKSRGGKEGERAVIDAYRAADSF